jgi:hypothetical protein
VVVAIALSVCRLIISFLLTCSGGWSEEGDAIIIKDMKVFSEKVIPTAYRHNNFASFVRQLNFCKLPVLIVSFDVFVVTLIPGMFCV